MKTCSWCDRPVNNLVEHPMPDDDYVEVCVDCSVKSDEVQEKKHSPTRLKTTLVV